MRFEGLAASGQDADRPSSGAALLDAGRERDADQPNVQPVEGRDASAEGGDGDGRDAAAPPRQEYPSDSGPPASTAPDASAEPEPEPKPSVDAAQDPFPSTDAAAMSNPDARPDASPNVPTDYCQSVPFLRAAPAVDGRLEPGLALETMEPVGWTGAAPLPEGQRAAFAVGWRPQGLYFYVRVWDPELRPNETLFCGDSVEVYVDHDAVIAASGSYDERGARQLIAAAPGPRATSAEEGTIYRGTIDLGDWTSGFGTFVADGGYTFEAFIRASDLGLFSWTLAAGGAIGFDLAHNVSRSSGQPVQCGERLGQYYLQLASPAQPDLPAEPYLNANAFCRPRLLARESPAPTP